MLIPVEDGIWDADARAELDEVAETIDARLGYVEEDVDTLGGLAFLLAGRVPQQGEIVEHPSGWRLEVTDSDRSEERRVGKERCQYVWISVVAVSLKKKHTIQSRQQ